MSCKDVVSIVALIVLSIYLLVREETEVLYVSINDLVIVSLIVVVVGACIARVHNEYRKEADRKKRLEQFKSRWE